MNLRFRKFRMNKLCEWLVITKKPNKLYKVGFLSSESQTMTTTLQKENQNIELNNLRWYLPPYSAATLSVKISDLRLKIKTDVFEFIIIFYCNCLSRLEQVWMMTPSLKQMK